MNSTQSSSSQNDSNQSPVLDQEELKERIASAHGFELFRHYSEKNAAKMLGISLSTIIRLRSGEQIGFLRKGTKSIAYFGFHLADYLLSNTKWPHPIEKPTS